MYVPNSYMELVFTKRQYITAIQKVYSTLKPTVSYHSLNTYSDLKTDDCGDITGFYSTKLWLFSIFAGSQTYYTKNNFVHTDI